MTYTPQEQQDTLEAFSATLRREAHVLAAQPNLLWQQLYNRLQWEPGITKKLAAEEFNRRISSGRSGWLHLKTSYQESQAFIRTLMGHGQQVTACDFSPDGTRLVSGSWDKTLKIWDVNSGRCEQTLVGHMGPWAVQDCCFSPDGQKIVSAGSDKKLIIWDAKTGKPIKTLTGHSGVVRSCRYGPDGKLIISASSDKSIKIWDSSSGNLLRSLEGYYKGVDLCRISPDGSLLIGASDKTIWIWDAASGTLIKKIYATKFGINDLGFSPDGRRFFAASSMSIFLWEGYEKDPIAKIKLKRAGTVRSCVFSADNKKIYAAVDKSIHIWDIDTLQHEQQLDGHTDTINHLASSSNGTLIASASIDKTLRLWDLDKPGEERVQSPEAKLGLTTFSTYSPSGRLIGSAGSTGELTLWEEEGGSIIHKLRGHRGSVRTCAFSAKGDKVVSSSHDKTLQLWDVESGKSIRTFYIGNKAFTAKISPDGNLISGSSLGHELRVWESSSGTLLYHLTPQKTDKPRVAPVGSLFTPQTAPGSTQDFCFSPDGRTIIAINNRELLFLSTQTGEIEDKIASKVDFFKKCVYSPDGGIILTANSNASKKSYTLNLWDAREKKLVKKINAHTGEINSCHFSPDGGLILTTSEEKVMKIWDLASGEVILSLPYAGSIQWGEFHPWKPAIIFCDHAAHVYRVECIGLSYKALILTAFEDGGKLTFQCPACRQEHPIQKSQLGSELSCPTPGCGLRIKLNPFSIKKLDLRIPLKETTPAKPQAVDSREIIKPSIQSKPSSKRSRAGTLGTRSPSTPATEKAKFVTYKRAAEKGDPNAQMMLGTMYASGKGVPKDLEEAAAWYRKAAEAGNASAQMLLGTCYLYGNGVIKDLSKAVELYRKAAQAGNRMAQYRLGECYAKGQGVPRDDQQAIHWYQKAADQNFSLAKTKLRVLQAKKSPSKPTQAAYISPRNSPVQSQKPASQLGRTNRPTPEDEIGKQAAALKARGDLNGALKLYKEQEKILREKKDIRALNFNLSQQSIILKELLKDIDGKIQDKLNKRRGRG